MSGVTVGLFMIMPTCPDFKSGTVFSEILISGSDFTLTEDIVITIDAIENNIAKVISIIINFSDTIFLTF